MTLVIAFFMGLLCVAIAVYGYHRTKYIFNPITAMFLVWGTILPFSCWGFYDTVVPNDRVYIIIGIGLIAYLLGVLCGLRPVEYSLGTRFYSGTDVDYKFNYVLFYVLGTIANIYYIFQMLIIIKLLRSGFDYNYIRHMAISTENNELRSSALVIWVKAFVATPMTYLTLAVFPLELLKKKKNYLVIVEAIVLMLFYLLTTGGRSVLLWCALYFIAVFLMRKKIGDYEKVRKTIRKYRRVILLGGIALLVVLLKMTVARKGEDVDLLNQMYIYFVCPLQFLDYHIDVVDASNEFGFGLSSFYGLLYPFMFILSKCGLRIFTDHVQTIYWMSFEGLQKGINIGGDIYMNAFVTAFYQPYVDGRYVGLIIVMLIFGFAAGRTFYKAYYTNDTKLLLLYLLLLQKIVFSYVRFYFTQQAQSICFLLAFLIITKCKDSDGEEKIIRF